MINYTERLTLLMQDIVSRVPTLSFIDMRGCAGVRAVGPIGRRRRVRDLPLPEPAAERAGLLLLARSRRPAQITRRSEWFVTKSPAVTIGARQVKYLISFALPRFCDQSLDRSRKERFYPGVERVDREARHGHSRAVSHRSRAERHPPASSAATAPTRPTATAISSSSRSPTWCTTYLDTRPIRRSTISCARLRRARQRASAASSARPSARSRRIRSASSSALDAAAAVRGRCWRTSRSSRCAPAQQPHALHRRRSARPPVHAARRRGGSSARAQFRAA